MNKLISCCLILLCIQTASAQDNPLWMRYPSISPDGKNIVFSYKGDLYKVASGGGTAVPLTLHEAHDFMPVWSHDGKYIAFASDRYGNFDVFIMPAEGGAPTRLTYNSAGDYPYDFTPDNKKVIFGSAREISANNVRFYSPRLFQNLYSVNVGGGRPVLISEAGMENAHFNANGSQIIFQDRKGYEDPWRKHHTSAVTRDIWLMDVNKATYRKLSGFEGEDREPVFSNDGQFFFYLSEKNGTQNIFKAPVLNKMAEQQLTTFKDNPVRHLSRSDDNTLCFTWNGEIYTLKEGKAQKVNISINADARTNNERILPISGGATEFAVSPNGKEIAFIFRGEVFVTSVEGGITKRITNTPQQERMVAWSPDSKKIIYAAERNNNWDIFQTTIVRKEEPYFYAATVLKEEPVIATDEEEFGPEFSPDGKEIAYFADRNILKVYNVASKKSRTILPKGRNYSYSDGDWGFKWSPDSKWIICDDQEGTWQYGNFALIKADGSGTIEKPIQSGYGQGNIKWALDGKAITWTNERLGRRSLAFQGSREVDIYAGFLDQTLFEKMKLSKDDYALAKEKEDQEKKTDSTKKKDSIAKANWKPLLTGFEDRVLRLTINSASIADYIVSSDGSKVYYLSSFERGYDLWVTEPRTRETKILVKLSGSPSSLELSKDGKSIFLISNGTIMKVDVESGRQSPVGISGEMVLNPAAERAYIFEHAWRQVKEKFYDPKIHGIDWKMYKETYARFLPHINNNYDFQELLSELLGELNGSHTGGRYSPQPVNGDATATLGLLYDETFTGNGLKIGGIIAGGPLDKSTSKIKAGNIIEKIDGDAITDEVDWAKFLNRKTGKNVLLSVFDPSTNTRFEETVKPISFGEESALMYKRWVDKMRKMTEELSGGKVGYVHVQGMNDGSFRTVFDEVLGKNYNKEALIVDTRFNGGGWLHNDLNTFLSGKAYLKFAPQGNIVNSNEPFDRWSKPSCVIMSEGNYSDAFIFPYIYKQNAVGKLIGMPVAGTGTAVWWETQIDPTLVFGIPMVATIGKEGRPTENLQVEPDIKVELPYEEFMKGKDRQLEAAVTEMLKEIKK